MDEHITKYLCCVTQKMTTKNALIDLRYMSTFYLVQCKT